MKLLTRRKYDQIFNRGYKLGIEHQRRVDEYNRNLNRPRTICNTGCRTAKCVKAKSPNKP